MDERVRKKKKAREREILCGRSFRTLLTLARDLCFIYSHTFGPFRNRCHCCSLYNPPTPFPVITPPTQKAYKHIQQPISHGHPKTPNVHSQKRNLLPAPAPAQAPRRAAPRAVRGRLEQKLGQGRPLPVAAAACPAHARSRALPPAAAVEGKGSHLRQGEERAHHVGGVHLCVWVVCG